MKSVENALRGKRYKWLVTGAAGFIGSHLCENLLELDQDVVGLDNFITGHRHNIDAVQKTKSGSFKFVEGDVRNAETCLMACENIDFVLHQAALGSVPRSIETPHLTHDCNVNGFFHILNSARKGGVKRFVYASSSSVYGDHPDLPKVESKVGQPLSPYALSKKINEQYASIFHHTYSYPTVGLRYFNVFGPRQDPNGPYAAVIPRWISQLKSGQPVTIFGDGETSRDFCYIKNVVQANLLAAITTNSAANGQVFNVAFGQGTSLNQLFNKLRDLTGTDPSLTPVYTDFRKGDVRHSLANTDQAKNLLGYEPTHDIDTGLKETVSWFLK